MCTWSPQRLRSSSQRLAKCSSLISRCGRGSKPRRTNATRFRNRISPTQWLAMPHPDGGGVPQYYYPPGVVMGTPMVGSGMYAPSQAWPAAAGDGEDDAEDNGGNGGGN